jgi:hypothetical protein
MYIAIDNVMDKVKNGEKSRAELSRQNDTKKDA